jgi:hypothetical protein
MAVAFRMWHGHRNIHKHVIGILFERSLAYSVLQYFPSHSNLSCEALITLTYYLCRTVVRHYSRGKLFDLTCMVLHPYVPLHERRFLAIRSITQ